MQRIHLMLGAWLCLLPACLLASTASADESIAAMRAELDALRTEYESRIQALEQRLDLAERERAQAQAAPPALQPSADYAATAAAATSGNAFNPGMGVVLSGFLRAFDKDPADYAIPGLPTGGEAGPGDQGLSLGETEFIYSANVDDWFYGQLTASVEQEDGDFNYALEEAYLDTLRMPASTTLRFGRFYSGIGYINDKHSHTWDFADQALPYSAFLGGQYGDDGIQFRWLAPTDHYLELGGEIFRGSSYPAAGDSHDGSGTRSLFVHVGGDVGFSNSWSAGLSWLGLDAEERASGDENDPLRFDGSTDLYIANFVWKWAPNGNIRERNLIFQTEFLWRTEDGDYLLPGASQTQPLDADATGWYAQMVYQWRPRWRMGLRVDGLNVDDPGSVFAGTSLDPQGDDLMRYSVMADYSNSEFSRIRLQLQRDESGIEDNNQLTLQYIMSIGAHGGHEF